MPAAGSPRGTAYSGLRLCCLNPLDLEDRPEQLSLTAEPPDGLVLGREDGLSGRLRCNGISRRHARVIPSADGWVVEDLNSTNGIFVNGERVASRRLADGDEIRLGPIRLRVQETEAEHWPTAEPESTVMLGASPFVDVSDRTMMANSREASEAVLKAARQADPEPVTQRFPPPRKAGQAQSPQGRTAHRASTQGKAAGGRSGFSVLVRLAALVVLVVTASLAGWRYYDHSRQASAVEAAVHAANTAARRLVETVRERPTADLLAGTWDEALRSLEPELSAALARAEQHRGSLPLINAAARLFFMDFERRFVPLVEARRLSEAEALLARTRSRLDRLGDTVPAGTRDTAVEDFRSAQDLVTLAGVLVSFRRFSADFPAGAARRPTAARLQQMLDLKGELARDRRLLNKSLSVHYLVLRALVADVEERDVAQVNHWKDVLDGRN